jgi:glutamate/tyrosine decarboxylase-like PLP-dependent enzyme
VVVGQDRHDTVDRSVRYLGLGEDAIEPVRSDDQGRIDPGHLAEVLSAGEGPVIVCLQAGEVHTGDFDPFEEAIPVAHRHGAWVHVDGAFGLWAAATSRYRHLTAGIDQADSWSTDAHKTLNVPYDCGAALVRDPAALGRAFGVQADYLISSAGDPVERVPEFSRRGRGFPVWAALRSLGRTGLAELVDGLCARAAQMAEGLRTVPGVEIVNDVVFTQVMLRLQDDDRTDELGRRILADGTAVFTPARWRGRAVQRCSVSSWATTEDDVERTVDAVRRLVAEL